MNIFYTENIAIFGIFAIFFSIIVLFYSEDIPEDVYGMIYMTPIIVTIIMSFSLSRRYRKIASFCYGHLILGLAFASHAGAEITWLLMDYWNLPQYESYPDIFYLFYGIFLIAHPWVIMRHFKIKPKLFAWLMFAVCVTVGDLIYVAISADYIEAESFLYGLAFVTLTNVLLGSVIVAILTLRGTKIFGVWILFGISFFMNAVADIYYYASENFSDWQQGDLVNIVWFVGYLMLIIGLLEHRYKYALNKIN